MNTKQAEQALFEMGYRRGDSIAFGRDVRWYPSGPGVLSYKDAELHELVVTDKIRLFRIFRDVPCQVFSSADEFKAWLAINGERYEPKTGPNVFD